MGQSNQKSEKQTPTSLNHKKMKHITFSKNGETMTASISVQDQQQFHKWEQKLSKLKKFDEYYLLIPKAYEFSKKGVCGSSGILNIDFDNYPYLLHDQILNRAQAGNFFTEVQLWYLLYGLVSAATIFKEVGFKVGDIQAKNVFLNEQGQMKVCNQCSWPSQRTNYQKLIFEGQPSYVSPQQVQLAKQGRVDIYQGRDRAGIDQYKSESFSIGLTMLQASLLALSDSLYNSSQKSINKKQLTRRLLGVMQNGNDRKYSKKLRQTIMALCQTSPQDRLSASQIYDKLKVHDSEITNLRQCEIQVPQIKLKQKYEVMMGKPNISQNAGYYTATASNTINNYNNSNSITGTNSTQLYYEPTHSNNSTYKAVTNTNANTNINTNKNTGGIHSLHGIHHNNNIGVINYSGTSNSNQPARVQVNFGPDKLQNGPFSDYKSGDNSLFVLSNTSPASSLYYTSPSSSNNYYGNLNPGSAPIPSSYLYSHSFANPLGNNSWKSGDGVNNSFGKNDIGSTSIQFGTQFSKKVQPYYSYPKPQQTKPITTATTKPVLEMGTGNSYLQSIYSSQQPAPMIKTPTFSTAPTTTFNPTQTFSSNLPSSNSYAFNNMALPPLPPINANRDIGKTQPNIGDLSEIKGYSFSNISSISRQHQYSVNKTADNIGVFTPTKQPSPSEAQKMNGDSMDLLKRIDEQILKSKSKFGESK